MRRNAIVLTALLATPLLGADWPGRAREMASEVQNAPPTRRVELLTEIAASTNPVAEQVVVAALLDPDASVRMSAADLCARHGFTSARGTLIGWLDDPQAEVRAAGAHALGAIGDDGTVPALVRLLGDSEMSVRLAAVGALATIGGAEVTVPLLDRLADNEATVRVATAQALGDLGDPRAVLSLLGTLQDAIPEVRAAAATALGKLHDARAARALLGLLHDPVADVRLPATRALGTLGDAQVVIDLAPIALRQATLGDPLARSQQARAAIDAIGRIGGPEAADVLVRAFRHSESDLTLAPAASQALRRLGPAARAVVPQLAAAPVPPSLVLPLVELLGDLGGEEASSALIGMLDTTDAARILPAFLRALGRTGTPDALRVLLRIAGERRDGNGREVETRRLAAVDGLVAYTRARDGLDPEALDPLVDVLHAGAAMAGDALHEFVATTATLLGQTHNPRASRVLAPLLHADAGEIRAAAANALANVGVSGAERDAADALGDDDPDVRLAIGEALGRFGERTALDSTLAAWAGTRPIDRSNAARAIARMGARLHDPRATNALAHALPDAVPGLAAALLDGLSYLVAAGDDTARAAIVASLDRGGLAVPALEALGNALQGAAPATRANIVSLLERDATDDRDPHVRATAVWALSHADPSAEPVLVRLLASPETSVLANAAGALARLYGRGAHASLAAIAALCPVLRERREATVRSNVLSALAGANASCDAELERRIVLEGRASFVRAAAARVVAITARGSDETARIAHAAVEQCAHADRDPATAQRCADILAPSSSAPPSRDAPTEEPLDALVIGDDGTAPLVHGDAAIQMSDGVIRVAITGPEGWVHERPAPRGDYVVFDPDTLAPEP